MSNWDISANIIGAGVPFFIQQDSDWVSKPSIAVMAPIASINSTFQWAGSTARTRTLSGYITSRTQYEALTDIAQSGQPTTLVIGADEDTTYTVYILAIKGNLVKCYNLPYLNLVTVDVVWGAVG